VGVRNKLNEQVDMGKINGYPAELKNKGLHGTAEICNQNIPSYSEFNDKFKELPEIYKEVIGAFYYAEGYIEELKNSLHVGAFKADEIEKRHFKFQPDLLIFELQKISKLLQEDYNVILGFEKELLVESLEGLYQNKKNLGIEAGKKTVGGITSVAKLLDNIEMNLTGLYSLVGLSPFIVQTPLNDPNNTVGLQDEIEIKNQYIRIRYSIAGINENIEKRVFEILKDKEILLVVGK